MHARLPQSARPRRGTQGKLQAKTVDWSTTTVGANQQKICNLKGDQNRANAGEDNDDVDALRVELDQMIMGDKQKNHSSVPSCRKHLG